ncbi:hypothetical protein ACIA8G_21145 [Lentzea sp. NPDC051213]|uniref:hypothetical protein n=1 Tax=Lentzea sp. NPDC051213 TaxID=3364126 RepID=UPI003789D201
MPNSADLRGTWAARPWGKIGKVIQAGFKALRAVNAFAKVVEKSRALLRQVDRIKETS